MAARLKSFYRKLGRIEKTFVLLVVLAVVLAYAVPASFIGLMADLCRLDHGRGSGHTAGQNRRQEADLAPAQPPDRGLCVHRHGADRA